MFRQLSSCTQLQAINNFVVGRVEVDDHHLVWDSIRPTQCTILLTWHWIKILINLKASLLLIQCNGGKERRDQKDADYSHGRRLAGDSREWKGVRNVFRGISIPTKVVRITRRIPGTNDKWRCSMEITYRKYVHTPVVWLKCLSFVWGIRRINRARMAQIHFWY